MARTITAGDWLDNGRLLRLLLVLALVLAPHALHLPPWITLTVVALLLWRAAAILRGWSLPGKVVRTLLTIVAFGGVLLTFGKSTGQEAGTAMLCLMIALKLTELRGRRDVTLVLLLLYFTLFTHFLRDQAMWTVPWMFGSVVLITALLVDGHRVHRRGWIPDLRESGRVLLYALPVMLALWVLFPRIPGPLWGTPIESASARTGISESMSPGDIADLIRSDAVAFRVRFDGPAPQPQQRYWRGPVLWHTDGRRWEVWRYGARESDLDIEMRGEPLRYELTLEPQRLQYVFALDMPDVQQLPRELEMNADGAAVFESRNSGRHVLSLRSHPNYTLQPSALDDRTRRAALHLPQSGNPRTRVLAERWREESASSEDIVDRALRHFRNEAFHYTLNPPALGSDSVDAFLFDTRRGFCEHYAGAFVTLMRAAGIPSRVVLGYQGGTQSLIGDYLIVRQSDAHAWAEIWVEDRGWLRIDPTGAVAPDRIEMNLQGALDASGERLPRRWSRDLALGNWVAARWDYANMQWNRWVLAYGPELQRAILSRIGLGDWQRMLLTLTAIMAVLMAIIAAVSIRAVLHMRPDDPAAAEWQRIVSHLQRIGLGQLPGEGPRDYSLRVRSRLRGSARAAFSDAADTYLRLRYLNARDEDREALLLRLRDARSRIPLVAGTGWLPWRWRRRAHSGSCNSSASSRPPSDG